MKAQDIYGLALRLAASFSLIWGGYYTLGGIVSLPATFLTAVTGNNYGYNSLEYFVYSVPALLFGLLALRFADALVGFTYREKSAPSLAGSCDGPPTRLRLANGITMIPMKAQDMFGIIFRVGALYLSFWGAWYTLAAVRRMILPDTAVATAATNHHSIVSYAFYGIADLVFGVLFFRYAHWFVHCTYRDELSSPSSKITTPLEGAPEDISQGST